MPYFTKLPIQLQVVCDFLKVITGETKVLFACVKMKILSVKKSTYLSFLLLHFTSRRYVVNEKLSIKLGAEDLKASDCDALS